MMRTFTNTDFDYNFKPKQQDKAYDVMSNILDNSDWKPIKNYLFYVSILKPDEAIKLFKDAINDNEIDAKENQELTGQNYNCVHAEINHYQKFINIAKNHPKWFWYQGDFLTDIHLVTYPKALEIKHGIQREYHRECQDMRDKINDCLDNGQKHTLKVSLQHNPKLLHFLGL